MTLGLGGSDNIKVWEQEGKSLLLLKTDSKIHRDRTVSEDEKDRTPRTVALSLSWRAFYEPFLLFVNSGISRFLPPVLKQWEGSQGWVDAGPQLHIFKVSNSFF